MIDLREMTPADLPLFQRWLSAPHVARWYHEPEEWLAEVTQMDGAFCWIHHYIAEQDGRPVGFCQFYAAGRSGEEWLDRLGTDGTYSLDYLIGDSGDLRRGFGRQILRRLTEEIARRKDAKRIAVQPEKENEASRALLLSCGFQCVDEDSGVFVRQLSGTPQACPEATLP